MTITADDTRIVTSADPVRAATRQARDLAIGHNTAAPRGRGPGALGDLARRAAGWNPVCWLERRVSIPGDDEETRRRKALFTLALILLIPFGVVWAGPYLVYGEPVAALTAMSYVAVTIAGGSQTRGELFGWKELAPISNTGDAVRAIEAIVEMGEGPRGDWRNAHFGRFLSVLSEYLQMRENAPDLEVARPVLPVLVRPPETGGEVNLITDPATARVADLCNVAYEVLLHLLYRLMSHIDESAEQIGTLATVTVGIMYDVIEPLADILSTMPVGPEHPGRTAGATFELFYQPDYLLPHRKAAWLVGAELLSGAAASAEIEIRRDGRLEPVALALRSYAETLRERAS